MYQTINGSKWEPLGWRINAIKSSKDIGLFLHDDLSVDGTTVAFMSPGVSNSQTDKATGVVRAYSFVEGDNSASSHWLQIGQSITLEKIGRSTSLSSDRKT